MIEVTKKDHEKPEALLRRFNRVVQESGLLKTVKEYRFYNKPPTRRERRESAQRKIMIKKLKNNFLIK
ncbi:MAG: 30S ribosomal protein S21 [Candidatus Berkelbacteria bacterium]|nr:30S ribosomal protein S21 [Candidatus Berkelbacteria bacterium]